MRSDEIFAFRVPQQISPGAFSARARLRELDGTADRTPCTISERTKPPLSHDAVLSAAATAPWVRAHQGSDRERDAGDRRVVDYLRPTLDVKGFFPWETDAARKEPFKIAESQRGVKYMINGSYPGPEIRAFENDTLELTIVNNLFSEATTIQ